MHSQTCVIVGAGVTGASAADALRNNGFGGRIIMLGDEPDPPYDRPPLSKQRLRGEVEREKIFSRPPDFYDRSRIELRIGTKASRIDPHTRSVELADGEKLEYDKLLIATGATPRRLTVQGSEKQGVYYLRTLADCEQIRHEAERRPKVLVLGTGFIGCEVAASLRQVGCDVVLAGRGLPLQHVLGSAVGEIYASLHRSRGVDVKTDVSVAEFQGSARLEAAELSDGSAIACDVAVVGIGVSPAVAVAPESLQLENGIVTDEFCRTNLDGIFAAGDVAFSWRPRLNRRARVEHFMNAQLQGAAAGRVMAGDTRPYDPLPYFWSDQFDLNLQYHGLAESWDRCIMRGKPAEYSFIAFYLRDGRIDAACIVNRPRELTKAKRLVGQTGIAEKALLDESADLGQLASEPTPR